MYKQSQQKAKDYIISWLNSNTNGLVFDIDTTDPNITILRCQSSTENIEMVMGETKIPRYVLSSIGNRITQSAIVSLDWVWIYAVRDLIKSVFKIYGFDVVQSNSLDSFFKILNIGSCICESYNAKTNCYDIIIPSFLFRDYSSTLSNKCPLFILLDPIKYFGLLELIIKGYKLKIDHTVGIYGLFLSNFPEENEALFVRYCMVYIILEHYYEDIRFLVLMKLIDLFRA